MYSLVVEGPYCNIVFLMLNNHLYYKPSWYLRTQDDHDTK